MQEDLHEAIDHLLLSQEQKAMAKGAAAPFLLRLRNSYEMGPYWTLVFSRSPRGFWLDCATTPFRLVRSWAEGKEHCPDSGWDAKEWASAILWTGPFR